MTAVVDNLDRPIETTNADSKIAITTYDGVGNVITKTDELVRTTRYGYDVLDRQTTRTDALDRTSTNGYTLISKSR